MQILGRNFYRDRENMACAPPQTIYVKLNFHKYIRTKFYSHKYMIERFNSSLFV